MTWNNSIPTDIRCRDRPWRHRRWPLRRLPPAQPRPVPPHSAQFSRRAGRSGFSPAQPSWHWAWSASCSFGPASCRCRRGQQPAQVSTTSLVILPFRNLSGDVTLDSLGSGLSGILQHRAWPVRSGADGGVGSRPPGAAGSADCGQRRVGAAGARAHRGPHQRSNRPVGILHPIGRADPYRRPASGSRQR